MPLGKPLQSKEQESNTQNLLMANSDATPGQRPRPCYGTAASQARRELASAAPPSAALWLGSVKKTRRYHPPPPKGVEYDPIGSVEHPCCRNIEIEDLSCMEFRLRS